MTMTGTGRSEYGAPFWEGCDRGELLVQYCQFCDKKISPPEPRCPQCIGSELTWIRSKPTGTVYSYSIVHRSPGPDFPTPYVLAVIDMDDGWSLLGNVVVDHSTEYEAIKCGSRVRVSFGPSADGSGTLPVFRLQPWKGCPPR